LLNFKALAPISLGIVVIISIFMGAVVAIQTAYNIDSPLIPLTMVGFTARQSMVLEFSPTIVSLILAGKIGSRIASEIGTNESYRTNRCSQNHGNKSTKLFNAT